MSGTVSLPDGPEIEIPSGAITSDTGFGAKKVTIKISKSKQKADLPGDLPTVGDIYGLQPEGLTFSVPVKITLPILENQDPKEILGLAAKDPESGEWVIVGSTVDAKARAVIGYSTHFSPWGIVGGRSEAAKTGGWVKVVNDYNSGSIDFPGCSYKPMTLEKGFASNPTLLNIEHSWFDQRST